MAARQAKEQLSTQDSVELKLLEATLTLDRPTFESIIQVVIVVEIRLVFVSVYCVMQNSS